MARRKKNCRQGLSHQRELAFRLHLEQLGCGCVLDYLAWCRENGFRAVPRKSALDLRHELAFYRKQAALSRLQKARSTRDPVSVIDRVCAGDLDVEDIASASLRDLSQRIVDAKPRTSERASLRRFLAFVGKETGLLTERELLQQHFVYYLDGLLAIHAQRRHWIRPFREWQARSHNRYRQFSSLLRHLFVQYDVPAFFESVWLRTDNTAETYRDWFIRIGQGESPRRAAPIAMTRRVAHCFLTAPDHYSVIQAIRWGQIHALGGDGRLCDAVIGTRLGDQIGDNDFWESVLRFFIRHPMLDLAQVGPIVDYLHNQKFEHQEILADDGPDRVLPPAQPNLSMHGRTPQSLLRQVDSWHRRLGRLNVDDTLRWKPIGIDSMTLVTGTEADRCVWRIAELLSHKELVREGSAMKHCVATYAASCKNRYTSIWGMTVEDAGGNVRRRQTIEVDCYKTIVQCRGKLNRLPNDREQQILARWAKSASLGIRLYL